MRNLSYKQLIQLPILIYPLLSGLLLFICWPTGSYSYFSLIAWVPLLLLFDAIEQKKRKRPFLLFLSNTYLALLLWNITTTWWVYNSTAAGAIFAIVVNALLMCVPFGLFYAVRKQAAGWISLSAFISFYVLFEYWHLNWQLSWPWLTLGNAWASMPYLVQWYEYTGSLGGSVWILLANVLIYSAIRYPSKKNNILAASFILLPMLLSLLVFYTYTEKGADIDVVVVQPNIDPYNEKFSSSKNFIPYEDQYQRLIDLSSRKLTDKTAFVLWPETALPAYLDEDHLPEHPLIFSLIKFAQEKKVSIVTGIDSYRYLDSLHQTPTSRKTEDGYYDSYNAALLITPELNMAVYHKSRLVPGVESLPYPEIFGGLTSSLDGIVNPIGVDSCTKVFFNETKTGVAPVICYESIFGEYVRDYVKNGAGIIGIITNDGWWGNTPGHQQHFQYARLRAIETRRPVARAANTGISGFINQRGEILKQSAYWKQDVLQQVIKSNTELTLYTRLGDYPGLLALIVSPILFISSFFIKRHV